MFPGMGKVRGLVSQLPSIPELQETNSVNSGSMTPALFPGSGHF